MAVQFGHFVESGPVEPEDDVLFSTRPDFVHNLRSIAEHIVTASRAPRPSPMIFGLYGKWGAGKSSALRLVEDLVREAAEQAGVSVFISEFDAPLWEQHNNVRASLALQILLSSPDVLTRATDLLSELRPADAGSLLANNGAQWDLQSSIKFLDALARYEGAPPMLEHWLREMIGRGRDNDEGRPIHVIFIDDLDRCSAEFTVQLLVATNYWVSARGAGIYFVLAANRAHLLESLQQSTFPLGPRSPAEALEKYVHLGFEVPDMLTNSREISAFLSQLLETAVSSVDRQRIGELQRLLELEPMDHPLDSVFAPVLHSADGRTTPRAVKYRLNTFLAEFRPQPQVELTPELVKRWILKAFWPDFWWRMIWPAETLDEVSASRVTTLRTIGRKLTPLWGMEGESLRQPFEHLADAEGLILNPLDDPAVAIYLAAEPAWEPPRAQQADADKLGSESGSAGETRSTDVPTLDARDLEPVDQRTPVSDRDVDAGNLPHDPQNRLIMSYMLARQEEESDPSEALAKTRDVLQIARGIHDLSGVSGTVGNAALIAERLDDVDLAIDLHRLAIHASPDRENLNLNFVQCILVSERTSYLKEAGEAVERALALPDRQQEFRARTLALRVRLALQDGLSDIASDFETLRIALTRDPNPSDLGRLLGVTKKKHLRWLMNLDALHKTCQTVFSACGTDAERFRTLKLLADTLFQWGENLETETDAARLLLYLLRTGTMARFGEPANAEKDIAYVLGRLGYKNAALAIYLDVYAVLAANNWLRRTLALNLNDRGYGKAAAGALLGQELPKIPIESEALPVDLLDPTGQWWDNLSWDESYPQYTSKALELIGPGPQ
ncbi:KAP-like P-loop domain-containing protein [Krasilnikovia cinnamomea]|uniref:KAP-like P-loop domain-containing protein n=1 Tax=Krasilnikovia cinnamomea TaxID=349313 RepID=A0A4Q7ZH31_9ACTN|nr:P-loop NTPase fold protein [Krasilnikovia cinnamomea]RZU50130.1 KAP-like P-loop domain-containing protein [Krasilnikovia cinnamomea]